MKRLFGEKLQLDWKIAVLVVVSTLLLIIDFYHEQLAPWVKWFPGWKDTGLSTSLFDRTLLYLVIPMLIVLLVFRGKPIEFGFSLGDWKAGCILTLSGINSSPRSCGWLLMGMWQCAARGLITAPRAARGAGSPIRTPGECRALTQRDRCGRHRNRRRGRRHIGTAATATARDQDHREHRIDEMSYATHARAPYPE